MKNLALISFLLVSIFCGLVCSQSHNAQWGNREIGDVLLFNQIVTVPKKLLRKATKDISFPPQGVPPIRKITYIKVTDQKQDGSGGYASILSGGVGYNYVDIHLKSQRSHGMNFIVEIYGFH